MLNILSLLLAVGHRCTSCLNPPFYRSFCSNILYQINDYERISKFSLIDSVEHKCAKLWLDHSYDNKVIVSSLFTHYSSNQIAIQKYASRYADYEISGCLGVTPDRLSTSIKARLTDRLDNIGILGASLGHLKMLEEFLESGRDFLVATESDAFVSYPCINDVLSSFSESSFDFVLCSDRHSNSFSLADSISLVDYVYPGRASGFDGYILNKKVARLILDEFQDIKYNLHIDGAIIKWCCNNPSISVGLSTFPLFTQSFTSVFSVRTLLELNY